jgi:hypothetical protein
VNRRDVLVIGLVAPIAAQINIELDFPFEFPAPYDRHDKCEDQACCDDYS